VAAAQEGAINGIPSCALSLAARRKGADFTAAAEFSRRLAAVALEEGLPQGVLLSANIPQDWNGGVRFTRQSKKITRNVLREDVDPRGRPFVWLCEQKAIDEVEPDTDYAAVSAGCVSITPLELDRTHSTSLNHLSHWAARLARV